MTKEEKEKLDLFQDWYYLNQNHLFNKVVEVMIEDGYIQDQRYLLDDENTDKAANYWEWLNNKAELYMIDCLE